MYKAALYLRLSREDGEKEESNSIGGQRALLLDFLQKNPSLQLCAQHVDDGFSGTNFARPAFCRMMEQVKAGDIDCILLKDLSRLGRNYIETGRYIEEIFPLLGVRLIAVNDGYDSACMQSFSNNLLIPFKNLMNDAYAQDISAKIKSQLAIKRQNGDFIGAFAPYGYHKSPRNAHRLEPDEEAAKVVKEIFAWKLEGLSQAQIAQALNNRAEPSPAVHKRADNPNYQTGFAGQKTPRWTAVAVGRILANAVYVGVTEQGKRAATSFRTKAAQALGGQAGVRVEGTHPPILAQADFEAVQNLLKRDMRASPVGQAHLLSGLLFCADCGENMVRKTAGRAPQKKACYVCCTHKADKNVCSTHRISAEALEEAAEVVANLFEQIQQGTPCSSPQPPLRTLVLRYAERLCVWEGGRIEWVSTRQAWQQSQP